MIIKKSLIWLIPSINIIIMNVFKYIETSFYWGSEQINNWYIQFIFVIINGLFYDLHYCLACVLPFILFKFKKEFAYNKILFTLTAVLSANLLMLNLELYKLDYENFPQYLIKPIIITMFCVIVISIFIVKWQEKERK